jgi:hypothetical protein
MFIKISALPYNIKFVKTTNDFNNVDKIEKELAEIKNIYPTDSEAKIAKVTYDNKVYSVFDFRELLKNQIDKITNKNVTDMYNSTIFGGLNYLNVNPELLQEKVQKELASLERNIIERENNLADIDLLMTQLVLNKEGVQMSIQHTNAKFVKTAEDDMVKEADEVIEDYYNKLYQDSKGSPDFGTALEHPEETKNELTTNIHHHRFKKKK